MPGGHVVTPPKARLYKAKMTWYVIFASMVAGSGGLLFGYDIGITGGVVGMDSFKAKFFPDVYAQTVAAANGQSAYCQYNNEYLQLFTSSLFLAGMIAAMVGGCTTRAWGRVRTMLLGGINFLIGAVLTCAAQNLAMLIVGRIILGFGVGLSVQCVPLYLSEIAPPQLRGALNIMFQLSVTIGILAAQLINYGTAHMVEYGWRVSLGLAGVPALLLITGGLILPETPDSLVERGHHARGRRNLEAIRGTTDVDEEFADIQAASLVASTVKTPLRNLFKKEYRGELLMCTCIPFFQQLTGINSIMFYAPVLFQSIGAGSKAALLQTVVTGVVNVAATFVSIATVDKAGRKVLLIEGGLQMLVAEVVMGVLLAVFFGGGAGEVMPANAAKGVLVVVCIFVSGFAWSWGPLGWLVPSEITSLETRSAALGITTAINFLMTFVIGQLFLTMLCALKWGIFIFFAAWVALMTLFVALFLPETKGVPLDEMHMVWRSHWFWASRIPARPVAGASPKGVEL